MLKKLISQARHLELKTSKKVNALFTGNYQSAFHGQGLEVSDLREYEEGDDVKYIDWLTSAKTGKTFIKKFQETRELSCFLVIDTSNSMKFTSTEKTKQELVLETAATLLFSALKSNDKFGAFIFHESKSKFIPFGKSKNHLLYILKTAIEFFEDEDKSLEKTEHKLPIYIKKHSLCFLVSDNIPKYFSEKDLKSFAQKHDFVFVNIFDPFEYGEIPEEGIFQFSESKNSEPQIINFSDEKLRTRFIALRKEKKDVIQKFLNANKINTLDISTKDDVFKKLLNFFQVKQQKR